MELLKWYRNITRSGLQNDHEYQTRRGILLTNYISLILSACLLLLFVLRRFYFGHIPGGLDTHFVSIGLVTFTFPILLNRLGMTTTSSLWLCYMPVLFIWYTYIMQISELTSVGLSAFDSIRIHLLAISCIPYLLLHRKTSVLLIFGILPTLISLLFFSSIMSFFGFDVDALISKDVESALMGSRTFVAYCVISVSCFIFQSIITYNDELNKKILSELKIKSQLIKSQNEELVRSHNRLNDLNLHLEDLVSKKTENIKQQNELLLKYAYSNAHHVRGPIARLLGLIQVSRLDTDLDYRWFFEKVEHETKQVDEIITVIAEELSRIDQNNLS